MATIIVRRPRRERMEEEPPEQIEMTREDRPIKGPWDPTLPAELEGLIPAEEWAQIVDRLDEYWVPLFKREQEIESCSMCLCCCCCCTLGLSLCAMCCYSSCAGSRLDKRKKNVRKQMKAYFEEELNPRYADKGIRFAVSPTIKTFYMEIRLADKSGGADARAPNSTQSTNTDDDEKEEEPLLKRDENQHYSSTSNVAPAATPSYETPHKDEKDDDDDAQPADEGLDGLD